MMEAAWMYPSAPMTASCPAGPSRPNNWLGSSKASGSGLLDPSELLLDRDVLKQLAARPAPPDQDQLFTHGFPGFHGADLGPRIAGLVREADIIRSEDRRVGKEGRSRWS